jgi:hypothetical protein
MSTPIPTDVELVDCAAAAYTRNDPIASTSDGAVRAFFSVLPSGVAVVAIEGTHNLPGWLIDFDALSTTDPVERAARALCAAGTVGPAVINHPQLGLLHAGFDSGAMAIAPKIALAVAGRPYALTGHSLGAAIALRLSAEFVIDGTPPLATGAYAPPRVGGEKFVKVVMSTLKYAWKWGDDPVPEVPFTLPPKYDYRQVMLSKTGQFLFDAFHCHAIANYVRAIHSAAAAA